MPSRFSEWNPVKSFPDYHGPYAVGTVDVEVPAAELPAPSEAPDGAQPTVAFRIFYPCVKPRKNGVDRPVRWVSQPQKATIASYVKFLGVRPKFAAAVSYLPQQLYWIKLPAHRNAELLDPPTSNGRWPVTMFSHGLAGSRNAYSQICGDLASNGMIVVALDHRDGSSPVQYVRATASTDAHIVPMKRIPHKPVTEEVYAGRDKQLRIRLWEISMAFEALVKIDNGHIVENLDSNTSRNRKERIEVLWRFSDKLDIHRAGKVSLAGHSFGAATCVQLLKSIYYHKERTASDGMPLISPHPDAALVGQITPDSPALLLDMWGLPLQSPQQSFLWERPLPSYAVEGWNGANILSVLSEPFKNWEDNLNIVRHVAQAPYTLCPASTVARVGREKGKLQPPHVGFRGPSPSSDSGYTSEISHSSPFLRRHASGESGLSTSPHATSSQAGSQPSRAERAHEPAAGPHLFYTQMSQHFSQSDFGVLFPWLAKRFAKAEEPERVLELNVRAMVQVVRQTGIEVGGADDPTILDRDGGIRRWIPVPLSTADVGATGEALAAVSRKLSVSLAESSVPSDAELCAPRDGTAMA